MNQTWKIVSPCTNESKTGRVPSMANESWSKKYYKNLTEAQHQANDTWFQNTLDMLTDTGVLVIPNLQKVFNKNGEETTNDGLI